MVIKGSSHCDFSRLAADTQPDILPNGIISNLIPRLFAIQDHGFLPGDFPLSSSSSAAKLPAGLQLRCWEARDPENYFSAEQCAVYRTRKVERERARAECLRLLDAMDDVEKLELLQGEKGDEKEKVTKELVRVC
jgi:hypothetical protein